MEKVNGRYSEDIMDSLVGLMKLFLKDHEIYKLMELVADAVATKEQENSHETCMGVQWINAKDKLPEKDGQYLVAYTFFNCRGMGVVRFSHNLHEIDEYIFDTESRPGWYEPDDEVGYFERTTVTHWAKLPEFPKEQ